MSRVLNSKYIQKSNPYISILKKLIWLYLILLIFEGALRKWLLPGLSNQLLIIRDPVALAIIFYAAKYNIKYTNPLLFLAIIITIISFFTAILFGHGNIYVALFGARIILLHFPVIYIMGTIFTKDDVEKVGKFLLWLSLPMTLLIAVQFYSPQSAFVNIGVGGNTEGAGFQGAGEYFRPPGIFSFISGLIGFYGLVAPFVLYFLFHSKNVSKILVYASLFALLLAIPLSISRTILFSVIITLFFVIISLSGESKKIGTILSGLFIIIFIIVIASTLSVFKTSLGAFTDRFTSASEYEGGIKGTLGNRFLGGLFNGIFEAFEGKIPFWGVGLGMGTNVAAQLLTGKAGFLVDEVEWGRIIGETGLLLGFVMVMARFSIGVGLFKKAYKQQKIGNALPWLLLSNSFLLILQGQLASPTGLGFCVVAVGLTLAAINNPKTV